MTEPNDIPERVSRLERSVAEARKDAAAARILAGGADRDVSEMRSELRTHTTLLNALRETQVDQGKEMREGFARTESRFAKVEGDMREGFTQVRNEFAQVRSEMGEGFAMLKKAIDRSNES